MKKTNRTRHPGRIFRAEAVRNSRISGTGLGLYITRKLVELQAEEIWVESALNQGSTFSWTLLLVTAEGKASEAPIAVLPG